MPHRKLLEDHLHLRVVADRMRLLVEAPRDALTETRWRKLLDHELRGLADSCEAHFEHEELGGYMRNLIASHPELGDRAHDFIEQHTAMRASLEAMIAAVGEGANVDELRAPIKSLLASLAAHESGETEMIQEALFHDTGAGD